MVAAIEHITKHFNTKLINFDLATIDKNQNGILDGRLGLIYYFFQMFKIENDQIYIEKISELLETVFEHCHNEELKISSDLNFCDGLSGLGFILKELIDAEILDENYSVQLNIISDLALEHSLNTIKDSNFDYLYGAIGSLYYLTEVKNLPHCEIIIEELHKIGKQSNFLFYNKHADASNEGINFGLAHGNTAIQMVLINLVEKGCTKKELFELIQNGVTQLLKYEKEESIIEGSIKTFFPHNVTMENGLENISRSVVLGWCNSEIDMALLINSFKKITKKDDYQLLSDKIGMESLKRKTEDTTGVYDYHFCHGSSGIAQLYQKLFNQTNITAYDTAYNYWINETILYLEKEKENEVNEKSINLLYGWPGALLTLQEYNNASIKGWDKLFLI